MAFHLRFVDCRTKIISRLQRQLCIMLKRWDSGRRKRTRFTAHQRNPRQMSLTFCRLSATMMQLSCRTGQRRLMIRRKSIEKKTRHVEFTTSFGITFSLYSFYGSIRLKPEACRHFEKEAKSCCRLFDRRTLSMRTTTRLWGLMPYLLDNECRRYADVLPAQQTCDLWAERGSSGRPLFTSKDHWDVNITKLKCIWQYTKH
ncbi:hypothetical protein KIN20_000995 [Parelaphostrongylus tenuis]|uniref:Uncharacterized protein n=1 Tax=Parelaphostrongylus tenuis TaxID=148309 RepID=A0AAD5QC87_PARTN|nr:hypothetical protein KIN20_000995 [Parelaphostrongylus tenuis]